MSVYPLYKSRTSNRTFAKSSGAHIFQIIYISQIDQSPRVPVIPFDHRDSLSHCAVIAFISHACHYIINNHTPRPHNFTSTSSSLRQKAKKEKREKKNNEQSPRRLVYLPTILGRPYKGGKQ
ncbi:hypothetical protein NC651_027449 [Populus alba x Populus x berolinensis]|nr:hypothetical protein NC651_027449 [Populus alba x Populus x berolinensis]